MTTTAQVRKAVKATQARLNAAEAKAASASAVRDAAVLKAATEGATRAELQDWTGLSAARVTQILRRARATITT